MGYYERDVIAITGAASGIGRALAHFLARDGCQGLALGDLDMEKLAKVQEECIGMRKNRDMVLTIHAVDVRLVDQLQNFADEIVGMHKGVSVLINNAGVVVVGSFEDQSKDQFDWQMDVNFNAVVNSTRIFLPLLKAQKRAHLINVSSMYGYFVHEDSSSYHCSKFAVRGFTEALVRESKRDYPHVQVHSVHPGFIKTDLMNNGQAGINVDIRDAQKMFETVSITNPEQAAEVILTMTKAGRSRILIGPDSILLDLWVRLLPESFVNNNLIRNPLLLYTAINSFLAAQIRNTLGVSDTSSLALCLLAQYFGVKKLRPFF